MANYLLDFFRTILLSITIERLLIGLLIEAEVAAVVLGNFQENSKDGGYLMTVNNELGQLSKATNNELDAKLVSILNRIGPDMKPSSSFTDFDDISVNVSQRAWILMRKHAQQILINKLSSIEPFMESRLKTAKVSENCYLASRRTVEAAKRLESWAVQLLSAWGNFPPVGLFEGTFGDIGSYQGCLNVAPNAAIGHAHYCSMAFKPILPTRRSYDLIINREPDDLLNLFAAGDAFGDILKNAQYSHYIYYKLGTCFPIECSPRDVQSLARLLGRESVLISGPVKCYSKNESDYDHSNGANEKSLEISTRDLNEGIYIWKPHWTRAQLISLCALAFVAAIVIFSTLVDISFNKIPKLYHRFSQQSELNYFSHNRAKEVVDYSRKRSSCEFVQSKQNYDKQETSFDLNNNQANFFINQNQKLDKLSYNCDQNNNEHGDNNGTVKMNKFQEIEIHRDEPEVMEKFQMNSPASSEIKAIKNFKQLNGSQSGGSFMAFVKDYSILTNFQEFFNISDGQLKNDILCINGIRCITMSWIIVAHTMQYNDWSAFARTLEIETHLKSLINQPLFNATYLVDTFFLMSGILTTFSMFKFENNLPTIGGVEKSLPKLINKFSIKSYLLGRYLRLTPQILFVSLLFIILPQLNRTGSPHWYSMTGEYSENCSKNWWINLLHIQAFYKSNEMCNFVCWWVSIDMFYHIISMFIIFMAYKYGLEFCRRTRSGAESKRTMPIARLPFNSSTIFNCTSIVIITFSLIQLVKHYQMDLPPNLLSTIPQTGLMWSKMTLKFFFMPYAHAFPFFFGLYIGYLMSLNKRLKPLELETDDPQKQPTFYSSLKLPKIFKHFLKTPQKALFGWLLVILLLTCVSYSTYFWIIGRYKYSRLLSTAFYFTCPILWALCVTYVILACQYNRGSFINRLLSCKLFLILGKASYLVYLSHFIILFTFFGSQNLLLEPTQLVMLYVIIGNITLSMLFGCFLCIVFEMPWLKTQKKLMKFIK